MDDLPPRVLGLRALTVFALVGVLALAALLALGALGPLARANARGARARSGLVLARAIAGQVALAPPGADLHALLAGAVGPAALSGALVVDETGRARARAGDRRLRPPPRPFVDRVRYGDDAVFVEVALPGRGAFAAEVSLAETANERALVLAVLLYTAAAGLAAAFVAYALLTRYTVRPVETLTRAAERVAAGRRDVQLEPRGARELARAAHAFNAMTRELAAREAELGARVEQLERTTRELDATQAGLVRSERLAVVGRLAAGLAHEVGNPLAAIVGLTDVLADGGASEAETRDFAVRIGREAQRIHRTVRELLDYARASPPSDGRAEEAGELGYAIGQVLRLLAPQRSLRDVVLRETLAEDLPRVAVGNDRLVQLLLNLVLNAAGAGARAIELRVAREGDSVVLEVEDDGPGIAEALRARVFEPFFTTKPAGEGTGLGLAICAVIAEQAGGSIAALDRRDGRSGARLRVVLPSRPNG